MSTAEETLASGSLAAIGKLIRAGHVSATETTHWFLANIKRNNHQGRVLNAVRHVSPGALDAAARLDRELAAGIDRGPLHGIPVLIKNNIMAGEEFATSAGAQALIDFKPRQCAMLVNRLRAAGAVIIGATNLTEFADYVSDIMPSGFSGAGGVVRNPFGIEYGRGQGSSVGSAAAVAAGFAPVAIGSETQNSIQAPASFSSVVGYKPSVGLISRAGVIPLVPSQDTPGAIARSVADAALLCAAMSGPDPRDSATLAAHCQYWHTSFRRPEKMQDIRIGVPRIAMADRDKYAPMMPLFEASLSALSRAGAVIVDPCDLPTAEELLAVMSCVFRAEFKASINALFEEHAPAGLTSLAELIAWNEANLRHIPYGQPLLLATEATHDLNDPAYRHDRLHDLALSRTGGINAALAAGGVDLLLAPGDAAAKCTGKAGAPALSIPVGLDGDNVPVGLCLFTSVGRDGLLLAAGELVERVIGQRCTPAGYCSRW